MYAVLVIVWHGRWSYWVCRDFDARSLHQFQTSDSSGHGRLCNDVNGSLPIGVATARW